MAKLLQLYTHICLSSYVANCYQHTFDGEVSSGSGRCDWCTSRLVKLSFTFVYSCISLHRIEDSEAATIHRHDIFGRLRGDLFTAFFSSITRAYSIPVQAQIVEGSVTWEKYILSWYIASIPVQAQIVEGSVTWEKYILSWYIASIPVQAQIVEGYVTWETVYTIMIYCLDTSSG